MMSPITAPYGSWKSPISADEVYGQFIGVGNIQHDGENLYWSELRPNGQTILVYQPPQGQATDLTPPQYDVRTRVHEYGGGDYLVVDGVVYFSNFTDQKLYRQAVGGKPQPFTRIEGMRYADAIVDRPRNRIIVVREDHTDKAAQAINCIVKISLANGGEEQIMVSGNDFYSTPRLNPAGTRLAWLTWNHPNMPWDGTELWVADVSSQGRLEKHKLVAGGKAESIFQPEWSPDGILYFVSDRTGWWNLYRWQEDTGEAEALAPMEAEFGEPQWIFGYSVYGFESAEKLICAYSRNGLYQLASLDTRTLSFQPILCPYTSIFELHVYAGKLYMIASSASEPNSLVQYDLARGKLTVLKRGRPVTIDQTYFSAGQPVEFPTNNGLTAFGFYYPPKNPEFAGPPGELPPLLVMSHGGPTGATNSGFRYGIQYWTTRGFAVLDVNYGGSTGYGRAYRERLKDQWGVVDVQDCVNGAQYCVDHRLADGKHLAIRGGSAGGYATLCAITFHKVFSAAASYFGISDLEAMAKDTHKFESRYLDSLIGPYPERRDLYISRSPIHFVKQIECPLILFQGLDDPIVPPNQSQMIFDALRTRNVPVAYLSFPGEQHGFVKFENNKRSQEAELYFYSRIFGFPLAEEIEPVKIENL